MLYKKSLVYRSRPALLPSTFLYQNKTLSHTRTLLPVTNVKSRIVVKAALQQRVHHDTANNGNNDTLICGAKPGVATISNNVDHRRDVSRAATHQQPHDATTSISTSIFTCILSTISSSRTSGLETYS